MDFPGFLLLWNNFFFFNPSAHQLLVVQGLMTKKISVQHFESPGFDAPLSGEMEKFQGKWSGKKLKMMEGLVLFSYEIDSPQTTCNRQFSSSEISCGNPTSEISNL